MYTVIGSRSALHHHVIPFREPKDWDIIATKDGAQEFLYRQGFSVEKEEKTEKGYIAFCNDKNIVEVELSESSENTAEILERVVDESDNVFASPEWLLFFKMSHRYKKDSPHFFKTRIDVEHMRSRGVSLPKESVSLLKERERLTYTNKLPNLNQKSKTFFREEDSFYKYNHDTIHEAVKLFDKPAYTYYLKGDSEVLTSKEKFFSIDNKIRLAGCIEECFVLALERALIPFDFKPDPRESFRVAYSKAASSITGGYFREYMWENMFAIFKLYEFLGKDWYVKKFNEGMNKGIILPFKEN